MEGGEECPTASNDAFLILSSVNNGGLVYLNMTKDQCIIVLFSSTKDIQTCSPSDLPFEGEGRGFACLFTGACSIIAIMVEAFVVSPFCSQKALSLPLCSLSLTFPLSPINRRPPGAATVERQSGTPFVNGNYHARGFGRCSHSSIKGSGRRIFVSLHNRIRQWALFTLCHRHYWVLCMDSKQQHTKLVYVLYNGRPTVTSEIHPSYIV